MYDNLMSVLHNRWVQSLGALLALAAAGMLFYLITPLLVPVFLAVLVAYLLNPLVVFLNRHGIRPSVTATSLALVSIIALICIPIFIVPMIINEADQLVSSARKTVARELHEPHSTDRETLLDRALDWLPQQELVKAMGWWPPATSLPQPGELAAEEESMPSVPEEPVAAPAEDSGAVPQGNEPGTPAVTGPPVLTDELARAIVADHVYTSLQENIAGLTRRYSGQVTGALRSGSTTFGDLARYVSQALVKALAFLVNFSVFAFATGYLMVSFDRLVVHAREIIPMQHRDYTLSVLGKVDFQMRSFVRGQVMVATINAVIYCIGLTISGVPFGAVIGLGTGFLSFIPYLGVLLGLVSSTLLVLVQYGFDWHIVGVLITFATVQTLEEVVSRPLILGDKIGLHPVWVMAAFLVFGHAFGVVGVLVAVPLAAILKVFVLELNDYYRNSKFYDDREIEAP